jgi:hypothetical protein
MLSCFCREILKFGKRVSAGKCFKITRLPTTVQKHALDVALATVASAFKKLQRSIRGLKAENTE